MITLNLRKRQNVLLDDVKGVTLSVTHGCVWITKEGDTRDVVLAPGETWTVDRDGLTIIEALGDTALNAHGGGVERVIGERTAARPAAALWPRLRARAAVWYSLLPRQPLRNASR